MHYCDQRLYRPAYIISACIRAYAEYRAVKSGYVLRVFPKHATFRLSAHWTEFYISVFKFNVFVLRRRLVMTVTLVSDGRRVRSRHRRRRNRHRDTSKTEIEARRRRRSNPVWSERCRPHEEPFGAESAVANQDSIERMQSAEPMHGAASYFLRY